MWGAPEWLDTVWYAAGACVVAYGVIRAKMG